MVSLGRKTAVRFHRGERITLDPHPGSPDPSDLRAVWRWVRGASSPTAIDLFCGAGGLSMGLAEAGFSVLLGADIDAEAVETHTANVGGLGFTGDLSSADSLLERLDAWGIDRVDLIAGGVPCQPFSRAGQAKLRDLVASGMRGQLDPRADLWRSFLSIVSALEPRAVLIENVPDLPQWNDGAVLSGLFSGLRDLGFGVDARVLNGFEYGVPQHRARLFLVGLRDREAFDWPKPYRTRRTVRDAIADLPPVPAGFREQLCAYSRRRQTSPFQREMRRGLRGAAARTVSDHVTRDVREDDMSAYVLLPEGGTYDQLPDELQRYRADIFTDKYKRLEWDELSRTITAHIAKDGYWYIHPTQHRTLSIREAARIQTFPDRFRFAGQPSHRLAQIGNAVPPMLASAVGKALMRTLSRGGSRRTLRAQAEEVRSRLIAWHEDNSREFPWRGRDLTPWEVLMAEMCLSRTRADQVTPVFEELRRVAPTPERLLEQSDAALVAMRSLGLRWRAENVIRVAEALVELFGGEVPDNDLQLRMLPGVGDYVAQTVLCFGFGRPAALLDTSTARVVGRHRGRDDQRRWQIRLDLHSMAGPGGPDAEFNYALLDLGALVCRTGAPRCGECPLRTDCVYAGARDGERASAAGDAEVASG